MPNHDCKACRDDYRVTEAQMERLLRSSMFAPSRRVSEEDYRERLRVCAVCPKFSDDGTCGVCGCIMPVVAWLKERGCPLPGGSAWRLLS